MSDLFERSLCNVIEIPVDVGSIASISQKIIQRADNPENHGGYVCVANVHMLSVAHENPKFRSVMKKADLTIADGIPLVWTQKLKGHHHAERVCGPDLMLELCQLASIHKLSIFLLGGSPHTLQLLTQKLGQLFPNLKIAGTYSPDLLPPEPELDLPLTEKINSSGASLLFVGLGCPKQEFWCASHAHYLKPLSIGVGAAFDFHAGTKKRPPIFIQQCGLEWLYRLISEPRRLWKRYLISNSIFLYLSVRDFIGY